MVNGMDSEVQDHIDALDKTWKKIRLETLGPFRVSVAGQRYVVCVFDLETKWAEFSPIKHLSPHAVACFILDVFTRFGLCVCELSGWAQVRRKCIIEETEERWQYLTSENDDDVQFAWNLIFPECPELLPDESNPTELKSEVTKQILDVVSGQKSTRECWSHDLDSLRLNIRSKSTRTFALMFGRRFLVSSFVSKKSQQFVGKKEDPKKPPPQDHVKFQIPESALLRNLLLSSKQAAPQAVYGPLDSSNDQSVVSIDSPLPGNVTVEQPAEVAGTEVVDVASKMVEVDTEIASDVICETESSKKTCFVKRRDGSFCKRSSLPYKCRKCTMTYFATHEELKLHEECHKDGPDGNTLFGCKFCEKAMRTWTGIRRHMLGHSEASAFLAALKKSLVSKCNYCRKSFTHQDGLKRHVQIVHLNDFPFSCEFCEQKFKDRTTFDRHKDKFHSQRSYKCDQCHYKTRVKSNLQLHKRIHDVRNSTSAV